MKAPQQQRSRESLERILSAAEDLVNSKGYDALTIAEVVRLSKTSVGTVYQRFPDKCSLVHALYTRVMSRQVENYRERTSKVDWSALSLDEAVLELTAIKARVNENLHKFHEEFTIHGNTTDMALRAESYRIKAIYEDIETSILMSYADQIPHENPEESIRIVIRLQQAALEENAQRLTSGVPGPGGVPQDILSDKLHQVIVVYLMNGSQPGPRDGNLP